MTVVVGVTLKNQLFITDFFRYNRPAACDAFRKCLEIRESHLNKDHLSIAQVLFELGELITHYIILHLVF